MQKDKNTTKEDSITYFWSERSFDFFITKGFTFRNHKTYENNWNAKGIHNTRGCFPKVKKLYTGLKIVVITRIDNNILLFSNSSCIIVVTYSITQKPENTNRIRQITFVEFGTIIF